MHRINQLLEEGNDFALETTLATRSYVSFVQKAKSLGFRVSLVYVWLSSPEQAMERVATRVSQGGHNIPSDVIERRYYKGISNLFNLFIPICDYWIVSDNSRGKLETIVSGTMDTEITVKNTDIWNSIKAQSL